MTRTICLRDPLAQEERMLDGMKVDMAIHLGLSSMNYVVSALTRMSVACIRKNRNTKRKEDSSWESTSMFRILKCERMSKCNARHAIDR